MVGPTPPNGPVINCPYCGAPSRIDTSAQRFTCPQCHQWCDMPKRSGGNSPWTYAVIAAGVVAFLLALTLALKFGDTRSPQRDADLAIHTCQGSVKKQLKDPDSAKFDEWRASQTGGSAPAGMAYDPGRGDVLYSASGLVNAKNAFGGYVGSRPFTCKAVISEDGDARAVATSVDDESAGAGR